MSESTTTSTSTTSSASPGQAGSTAKAVWPCFHYDDAQAAIKFLNEAFGFELVACYPPEGETVDHAEMRWPEGGGIMLGSRRDDHPPFSNRPAGSGSTYVVTDHPDELYAKAKAAGAEIVQGLRDEDYGSRGFSGADPEGNTWSFGTYRGA